MLALNSRTGRPCSVLWSRAFSTGEKEEEEGGGGGGVCVHVSVRPSICLSWEEERWS